MVNVASLDISELLDSEKVITEYLRDCAEDPNSDVFLCALGEVAKEQGMTELAKKTGLGRESLYKALSACGNPTYSTLRKVFSALDVKLDVQCVKVEA